MIQARFHILPTGYGMDLHIEIFSVAGQTNAEGSGKGHDLMRGKTGRICNINMCAAHCFLKVSHDIQMSDKFQTAAFRKLDTKHHV